MAVTLEHPSGVVRVEDLPGGRRRLRVQLADASVYSPVSECETGYELDLIESLLEAKGSAWICDEIRRDESPSYLQKDLRFAILSFIPDEQLAGARLLDFGCGAGASTVVLARMFPETQIVGIELEPDLLALAKRRVAHYGLENIELRRSPSGDRLPDGIGSFDFICLSAVFEHLLPDERRPLLAQLWALLGDGGIVFLNETPHRWNPLESHTTNLPLLNYLPAPLALRLARRSPRAGSDESWESLLRRGIRGSTQHEVVRMLQEAGDGRPVLMQPTRLGLKDVVDLWYAKGAPTLRRRAVAAGMKAVNRVRGGGFVPYLYIAVRKQA
jgi:2-polyprenyl-3-methyl-5-hydroxy-6-metoxy-1,4-benzoquinol methylase